VSLFEHLYLLFAAEIAQMPAFDSQSKSRSEKEDGSISSGSIEEIVAGVLP